MRALIDGFSGTGNAARAAGILESGLAGAGWEIERREIGYPSSAAALGAALGAAQDAARDAARDAAAPPESGRPGDSEGEGAPSLLVLAFPVYSFSPPVMVKRWIRRLPRGDRGRRRIPAIVLCADGGGGGQAPDQACRMLARRGYEPVASANVSYPENWTEMANPMRPEAAARATEGGDQATRDFARLAVAAAAGGPKALHRQPPASAALGAFVGAMFGLLGRRMLGKFFFADADCTGCGLCERICPAGAISLGGRPATGAPALPRWNASCENCCRCINYCPTKAINTSWGRIIVLGIGSVAALWAAVGPFMGWLGPLLDGAVQGAGPLAARAARWAAAALAGIASQVLVVGPVDRWAIRPLSRLPGLRRLFSWTFTKGFRRYSQEGFKPRGRRRAAPGVKAEAADAASGA